MLGGYILGKNAEFEAFNLKPILNVTKIYTMYYYEFQSDYEWEEEVLDFWQLIYVDKGECIITSGEHYFSMEVGNIFLHRPGTRRTIKGNKNSNFNVLILTFACTSSAMDILPSECVQVSTAQKSTLSKIIRECRNAFYLPIIDKGVLEIQAKPTTPIGSRQLIKIYLEELLIMIMRREHKKSKSDVLSLLTSKDIDQGNIAASIESYLKENLDKKITIATICKVFNYNKTYVCTHFKKSTGYSIIEYLNLAKIEKAKDMIREDSYSLSEISETLGFSTPGYFSKIFKKITGLSPLEYKRNLRNLLGYDIK